MPKSVKALAVLPKRKIFQSSFGRVDIGFIKGSQHIEATTPTARVR